MRISYTVPDEAIVLARRTFSDIASTGDASDIGVGVWSTDDAVEALRECRREISSTDDPLRADIGRCIAERLRELVLGHTEGDGWLTFPGNLTGFATLLCELLNSPQHARLLSSPLPTGFFWLLYCERIRS